MERRRSLGAAVAVVLAAVAVSIASCSNAEPDAQTTSTSEQPAITGEPAGFNADDTTFATTIVAIDQQALELTAMAPGQSVNTQLVTLASDIGATLRPQRELAKVLLVQWNSSSEDQQRDGGSVAGTVDDATMARLGALSGPDFDTLWVQSMIGHHQKAIDVADGEIGRGENADAVSLARQISTTQRTQLAQLQQLLAES